MGRRKINDEPLLLEVARLLVKNPKSSIRAAVLALPDMWPTPVASEDAVIHRIQDKMRVAGSHYQNLVRLEQAAAPSRTLDVRRRGRRRSRGALAEFRRIAGEIDRTTGSSLEAFRQLQRQIEPFMDPTLPFLRQMEQGLESVKPFYRDLSLLASMREPEALTAFRRNWSRLISTDL